MKPHPSLGEDAAAAQWGTAPPSRTSRDTGGSARSVSRPSLPSSPPSLSHPSLSQPSLSQLSLPDRYVDAPSPKLAQMVQLHLLGALQGLYEYASRRPAQEQDEWRARLSTLQALLRQVRMHSVSNPEVRESADAIDPARIAEFGRTVEKARKKAKLSRAELAKRAGLSENTVRNVEEGANVPTQATLLRLLAVRELGLGADDVPWLLTESASFGAAPACWIAPGYDPLQLFTQLFEVLNGSGGSLDPTYAYLDHGSAVDWYELSNQASFAAKYRQRMPLESMARRILEETRHAKLDVIGLGSGDGKQEVQLVQHLLDQAEALRQRPTLRLYLLDVSQPLLSAGYKHAVDTIQGRDVHVYAIQGDFNHLPQYTLLHPLAERAHRRRVVLMLGSTLSHVEHEPRFFRHGLASYAPGDLLLLDVSLACGSPERPEEIRRKDPMLRTGLSPAHRDWLSGPIKRYCEDVETVELDLSLDTQCAIPGSYTLEVLATARTNRGRTKRFSVFRFRRYEPERLIALMRTMGWERVAEAPFGMDGGVPEYMLLLFRRLGEGSE
jgi:transcriptional regulator with XRE-family HTH domain